MTPQDDAPDEPDLAESADADEAPPSGEEASRSPITRDDIHLIIAIFLGSLIGVQAWDISDIPPLDATWGATPEGGESTAGIASTLFTDWAIPFEVLSLLLVVALVGALAVAVREDTQGGGS